jgi:hypothetical protein
MNFTSDIKKEIISRSESRRKKRVEKIFPPKKLRSLHLLEQAASLVLLTERLPFLL